MVSGFISEKRKNLVCKDVVVSIKNESRYGLLDKKEIAALIIKKENVKGKPIKEVNLKNIENFLNRNRSIKVADTYITEDGILHVQITHRIPVIRICDQKYRNFYLDAEGNIIPLSKHFSPLVIFANGNIKIPFDLQKNTNIYVNDNIKNYSVHQLLELAKFINGNSFWKSQIVQMYVNDKSEIELVPRIGAHIILFGDIKNYEEKFENLKLLYTDVFNKVGWNEYVLINLKYKDQIICTKR